MSSARDRILHTLKMHLPDRECNASADESVTRPMPPGNEQNIERFVQLLQQNHAEVLRLDRHEIAETVKAQLQKRHIDALMCGPYWRKVLKPIEGEIALNGFYPTIDGNKDALFNQVPAAITGSHSGIAATGSIVLWPTPEEPRTLSLVPPLHMVVVEQNTIHPRFDELMASQNWKTQLPTNVVLVSGPSKTADIQQTLAYGAHGPNELLVLLVT